MKLVLPDHTQVSIEDLERLQDKAVSEWRKADKAMKHATNRMAASENVVRGCRVRIRLLRILESEESQ